MDGLRWLAFADQITFGRIIAIRLRYIDGLRAIAVLLVVVMHAAKYSATALGSLHGVALDDRLRSFLLNGSHGVDLFFVISGFCLTYPYLSAAHEHGTGRLDLVEYLTRRIVRIVPPYYIAVAVFSTLIVVLILNGQAIPFGAMSWPSNGLDSLRQLLFVDRDGSFVNGSFWTLAVEWRWYFAMPVFLLIWSRNRRAFWAIAFTALLLYQTTALHVIDVATLPAFMLGIVAAQIAVDGSSKWARYAPLGALGSIVAALTFAHVIRDPSVFQDQVFWQLAAFCLVVAAGNVGRFHSFLAARPLVFIGIASYSIYLVHEPIIALVEQRTSAGAIIAALIALVFGVAFWAIFERPLVRGPIRDALRRSIRPVIQRLSAWLRLPSDVVTSQPKVPLMPLGIVHPDESLVYRR